MRKLRSQRWLFFSAQSVTTENCAVFVCEVLTGVECSKFTPGSLDSKVSDGSVVALGSRFTIFSSLRLTLTGTSDWLPARLQLNYRTHHT